MTTILKDFLTEAEIKAFANELFEATMKRANHAQDAQSEIDGIIENVRAALHASMNEVRKSEADHFRQNHRDTHLRDVSGIYELAMDKLRTAENLPDDISIFMRSLQESDRCMASHARTCYAAA